MLDTGRILKLYPSQLRPGDYWYEVDATRIGHRPTKYRVTVLVNEGDYGRAYFTGKRQVRLKVDGHHIFDHRAGYRDLYAGERKEVCRP